MFIIQSDCIQQWQWIENAGENGRIVFLKMPTVGISLQNDTWIDAKNVSFINDSTDTLF